MVVRSLMEISKKLDQVEGLNTIDSLDDLPSPSSTSVSIITPPSVCSYSLDPYHATRVVASDLSGQVTLAALRKAEDLGIPAVWIQPGASDEAVERYISENRLADKVIHGGPCILVHGDKLLSSRL